MKTLPLLIALSAFLVVGACESPMDGDATGDPTTPTSILRLSNGQAKVDLCHRTGSQTNPWVLINVSEASVQKHVARHGDLYPGEAIDEASVVDDTCQVVAIGDYCANPDLDDIRNVCEVDPPPPPPDDRF